MNFYGFVTSSRHCGQDLRSCPACGKETFHALERRKDWFTLFFLPIVPLSRGRGLARCNLCGQETVEGGGVRDSGLVCPALLAAAVTRSNRLRLRTNPPPAG